MLLYVMLCHRDSLVAALACTVLSREVANKIPISNGLFREAQPQEDACSTSQIEASPEPEVRNQRVA